MLPAPFDRTQVKDLTTADFLGWCEQLASVLAYLHGCSPPIVHRDVKLDNVRRGGWQGLISVGTVVWCSADCLIDGHIA